MAYQLEGRMLEVCTCKAVCPCWVGEDPDGGTVAVLVQLVGEVVGVERAPITFTVEKGRGTVKIGDSIEAEMVPLQGATGATTLNDSAFSSIPGSPAYVGKAPKYRASSPALGLNINLTDHTSVQGRFRFA